MIQPEAEYVTLNDGRHRRFNVGKDSLRYVKVWLGIKSGGKSPRCSIETVGWDGVIGEWIPKKFSWIGRIRAAGRRVVDFVRIFRPPEAIRSDRCCPFLAGKIARNFIRGKRRAELGSGSRIAISLPIARKPGVLADDGTAQIGAVLILSVDEALCIRISLRIQNVVAEKLPYIPMELVGSRPGDKVDIRAARYGELRIRNVPLHVELFNGVGRR